MRLRSPARSGSRLIVLLLMSTPLLGGCGLTEVFHLLGGSETKTVVKIECPPLAYPPDKVLDALDTVKGDPDSASWIVSLDKHLQKLDRCPPTKGK
jgi:hypothetical protein